MTEYALDNIGKRKLVITDGQPDQPDMVNHPPHYTRGPLVNSLGKAERVIECIEVIRHMTDMRLATAVKYLWRVAFGGKNDDREDVAKAIWYLQDFLDNPIEGKRP